LWVSSLRRRLGAPGDGRFVLSWQRCGEQQLVSAIDA
jgi:hypothetical protein